MRILFVSNFYPPYARGGYELWCSEVAEELTRRGNHVCVLTSESSSGPEIVKENNVDIYRVLNLEVENGLLNTLIRLLSAYKRIEQDNLDQTRAAVEKFSPDIVMVWGMWNISRSVPALLEQMLPGRVAYYICDYWLTLPNAYIQRLREPAQRQWLNGAKKLLGKVFLSSLEKEPVVDLELNHPICVSNAVKELLISSDIPVQHSKVVYGGTQIEQFSLRDSSKVGRKLQGELKLLYIGRLEPEKGVHTAIQAVSAVHQMLMDDLDQSTVTLDVIGLGNSSYSEYLELIVQEHNIENKVTFLKSVKRSEIPEIMMRYDALIFPSEWPEPFARTVLEAMAAELLVIGTTAGGTGELLINMETGLTFSVGDSGELANQIIRVLNAPELRLRLAGSGSERVKEYFTFESMVDQFQKIFREIMEQS